MSKAPSSQLNELLSNLDHFHDKLIMKVIKRVHAILQTVFINLKH